jgi:hypothetical protein
LLWAVVGKIKVIRLRAKNRKIIGSL